MISFPLNIRSDLSVMQSHWTQLTTYICLRLLQVKHTCTQAFFFVLVIFFKCVSFLLLLIQTIRLSLHQSLEHDTFTIKILPNNKYLHSGVKGEINAEIILTHLHILYAH